MSVRRDLLDTLFFGRDPFAGFPFQDTPRDLQGWHSGHPYLSRAIEQVRPRVVVEVGVWKGASVVTMARAMQRLKLDGVIIAIDTWLGSAEHYKEKFIADMDFEFGHPRLYRKFLANICHEGLTDYVVPLPLDSINAYELLKQRGVRPDVLHIDAGHDYASVMADLQAWWPQLTPGGVLIGDDYFKAGFVQGLIGKEKWPEVRQAFDEFFAANAHTVFESGDGKCYVGKPGSFSPSP